MLDLPNFRVPSPELVTYDFFTEAEVAGYDSAMQRGDGALEANCIDDATWRDLDVRAYLKHAAQRAGLLARQILVHRLRSGSEDPDFTRPLEQALADGHAQTPALLVAALPGRQTLRSISADLTPTLFGNARIVVPAWVRHLWLAPALALVALLLPWGPLAALSFLTPWLLAGYLVLNGWMQIRLARSLQSWHRQRDTVLVLLRAALQLADAGHSGPAQGHPVLQPLCEAQARNRKLLALLSPSWAERTPMFAEYANLFALQQYKRLGHDIARLYNQLPELRDVYLQLARAEAQICLLEHLPDTRAQGPVCAAKFVPDSPSGNPVPELHVQGLVNPLLAEAQALDMHLQNGRGALLTGQNGVGKSTWLRGLGLSLLTARAFGFCYATRARVPRLAVWSSIHSEDSLTAGESLYMAEMRRAETLLRVARTPGTAVFLIDEIFKGTNNAESVAAAAAVLSHLARHALVVVSTHNTVLAPLLQTRLLALRLTPNEAGLLSLEPGVLLHTNGLRMMAHYDFPQSVREAAQRVHGWYSAYVAEPTEPPDLLLKQ